MRRTVPFFAQAARAAGRVVIDSNAVSKGKPARRRTLRKLPDAIKITDNAADRIKELMANHPEAKGVRVGVRTRGCNGLSYVKSSEVEMPVVIGSTQIVRSKCCLLDSRRSCAGDTVTYRDTRFLSDSLL